MNEQLSLFDSREVNIPLANKIESFYSAGVQTMLPSQVERVFDAITRIHNPSQHDISEYTGIPRHLIPFRVKKLLEQNRIIITGSKTDPDTGKEVTTYKET